MENLVINGNGSPVVLATGNKDLAVGCPGTGRLDLVGILGILNSSPASGTAAAGLLTSGTVDTSNPWSRVITAGAVTGVILEAGVRNGQLFILTSDKDSSGSITMAAESTSNVANGVTNVIVAGTSRMYIWDATDTCWSPFSAT